MKTNYSSYPSPYKTRERMNPLEEEVMKNTGSFNLKVTIEKDLDMIKEFSHIQNFIAFKTTLRNENNVVVGIGIGTGVVSRLNKFLERTCIFSKNASLIDAMMKSIKIIDALSIMPNNQNQKETSIPVEEDSDKQAFYGDEDMPQYATEKQRAFLSQLLEKCNNSSKEQYLNQIKSPYLSRFDASELISSLLPMK